MDFYKKLCEADLMWHDTFKDLNPKTRCSMPLYNVYSFPLKGKQNPNVVMEDGKTIGSLPKNQMYVIPHVFKTTGDGYFEFYNLLSSCGEDNPKPECGIPKLIISNSKNKNKIQTDEDISLFHDFCPHDKIYVIYENFKSIVINDTNNNMGMVVITPNCIKVLIL